MADVMDVLSVSKATAPCGLPLEYRLSPHSRDAVAACSTRHLLSFELSTWKPSRTLTDQESDPNSAHVKPVQPFLDTLANPPSSLFPLPLEHTLRHRRYGRVVSLLDVV